VITISHWMGTYVLDPFWWPLLFWLVVRWVRPHREGVRDDRPLLWAGPVTALSLETKFLVPAFWAMAGISAAVLGPRELLRRPKLWIGAALTVVSLPIYPASVVARVPATWGIISSGAGFAQGELPAQQMGTVAGSAYATLSPAKKAHTVVFSDIYPFAYFASVTPVADGVVWRYSGHERPWAVIWPALKSQ